MAKKIINYYKILKVKKDADTETIKRKCKLGLKKYDKENHPKENKILCNAYKILTDDKKRAKYDKLLEKQEEEKKEDEKIIEKFESKKMKSHGKRRKRRGKFGRKNKNYSNALNYASNVEKEYGVVSKVFKGMIGNAKSQPLMTGANLLLGGAIAGAGVKKGRNFMSKRKG